jgi:hypothetical protein
MGFDNKREPLTWETAPDVLTVAEAANLARIPRNGMYAAVSLGIVPSANLGKRRIRIMKQALAEVIRPGGEARRTAAFSPSEAQ